MYSPKNVKVLLNKRTLRGRPDNYQVCNLGAQFDIALSGTMWSESRDYKIGARAFTHTPPEARTMWCWNGAWAFCVQKVSLREQNAQPKVRENSLLDKCTLRGRIMFTDCFCTCFG